MRTSGRRTRSEAKRPSKGKSKSADEREQHPWGPKVAIVGGILAAAVAAVTLFTPAVGWISSWIQSWPPVMAGKYDKTSPITTKCVQDNEEWKTFRFSQPGSAVEPATTMRVNGSEACKTAWVFVANSIDGTRVDKSIERLEGDGVGKVQTSTSEDLTINPLTDQDGRKVIGDNGKSYTDQVYAPGCVWVGLKLVDEATDAVIWEIPKQEVCKP